MKYFFSKPVIAVIAILVLVILGVFVFGIFQESPKPLAVVVKTLEPKITLIGNSVQGREINAYSYGNGATKLSFVGGIHGGYEWNSVLLAYQFMDYLEANPEILPADITVTVIPSANPDGVFKVIGKEGRFTIADVPADKDESLGRFNVNGVDLNRNFDCKWQPKATWKDKTVSAGTKAFSEPESQAIKDFVKEFNPVAVVFWHSQSNAVYASECKNGILPETLDIMNAYAKASGYPAVKSFSSYAVTGDAEGWLASIGIPAITVELQTHKTVEWDRNLSGIRSLFDYYGQKGELKI